MTWNVSLVRCRRAVQFALVTLVAMSVGWGCGSSDSGVSDPYPPTITVSNPTATRDSSTLPAVTVQYSVRYHDDTYAAKYDGVFEVHCTMKQTQKTRVASYSGKANCPGTSVGPHTGSVTINVPDAGKYSAGDWDIVCTVWGGSDRATSNIVTVTVPAHPDCIVSPLWYATLPAFCTDPGGGGTTDPRGVHYGPIDVPHDRWVATGGSARRGDTITVEAGGTIIFKNGTTCGIDGCGHWAWWELAAKVGTQVKWVGSSGTMLAEQDGPVELGLPRGTTFVPEDYSSTDPSANPIVGSTTVADVWIKSP
jgi:hypothetical protein